MPRPLTKADEVLKQLVEWRGDEANEQDLYPFVKEFFRYVIGYPVERVRIGQTRAGGFPDISLCGEDAKPKDGIFWLVGEVKPEAGRFQEEKEREDVWKGQLKKYVSADTVYALLIDPKTIAVLRPDGSEVNVVKLDQFLGRAKSLADDTNLGLLSYKNSVSDVSLRPFKEGKAPSRFLDVTDEATRKKFYEALRISSRELINYSTDRLRKLLADYEEMERELSELEAKTTHQEDPAYVRVRGAIQRRHSQAQAFTESILPAFRSQIGRELPEDETEAERLLLNVYATEGSSLVLARILFVRFFEDHDLTTRKISNGGIKAFRNFYRDVRDDYRHLLSDAFKDLERRYRRLFEPSVFDFSHEGDGELSRLLLRIFYRLNAFEFTKITGDILGNLYERFLDVNARKKLGEFYTPMPVARYVLERIGFYDDPGPLLDPGNGSGTFLIAATVGLIERLRAKGVSVQQAVEQAVALVHGLDINMFAAFIAQLQLIWHLFPYLSEAKMKEIPNLKVYGGVNSLVYDPQQTLASSILVGSAESVDMSTRLRDSRYRYVVGNPPYIRNERFKDWGEWRAFYHEVDHKNSDVAFYFVKRAIDGGQIDQKDRPPSMMPSWLQEGGRMCWVLPLGVCDSSAAAPLREKLLRYNVFEITDLEDVAHALFPSAIASTRATVAPILLFAERRASANDTVMRLVRVTKPCLAEDRLRIELADTTEILQSMFASNPINPYGQILTKLRDKDLPVLEKLMSAGRVVEFSEEPTPCYGIKVGVAGLLSDKPESGQLPLLKVQNISSFYLSTASNQWVDPLKCKDPSIWRSEKIRSRQALSFSEIALAPQAANFVPDKHAINNSAIVLVPKREYAHVPWDILLNSSPARFVYLLILRSGLIGVGTPVGNGKTAAWSHVYPRCVDALPVPRELVEKPGDLSVIAKEIREVASAIAQRWGTIAATYAAAEKRSLALSPVTWEGWEDPNVEVEGDASVSKADGAWRLHFYEDDQQKLSYIGGPYEILNVVSYLLERREEITTAKGELERLEIPVDSRSLSILIDQARDENSPDRRRYRELAAKADEVVMDAFGLNREQRDYVRERLSTPPFDVMQPRWPWAEVSMRGIQEYPDDRFD